MAADAGQRVLAVDLGGTNIRVAVVSTDGELTYRQAIRTDAKDGHVRVIQRMIDLVNEVAATAGLGPDNPVGVASPGPLDPNTGIVLFTPNLPGWRDVPLGPSLADGTGRRVSVANDGNCAALGEMRFGSGKGAKNLVYLALGTGVGGGVISDGRLVDGIRGFGAELGHSVVSLDGPRCTCGGIGCLESFVAGWAIGREGELVATTADGEAILAAANGGPVTAGAVATAAQGGDPAAVAILARAGRALGAAIGSFVNIFNPEVIVIGGGVAAIGDLLLGPARHSIPSYSFVANRSCMRIALSSLGDDTALFGAAALALGSTTGV